MPTREHTQPDKLNGRTVRIPGEGEYLDKEHVSFELPSRTGAVSLRRMKGRDQNLMMVDNRKDLMLPFFKMLDSCSPAPLNYKTMTQNDFMFALFILRRLSYGDWFRFGCKCPSCDNRFDWEEDLASTEVVYASDEFRAIMQDTGEFEYTMPLGGQLIKYRQPVAADYQAMRVKYTQNRDHFVTESLRLCITDIQKDGRWQGYIGPRDIEDIEAFDLASLKQHMDAQSLGVVTTIDVECPSCRAVFETDMPLSDKDFLLAPSAMKLREDSRLSTLYPFPIQSTSESASGVSAAPKTATEQTSPTAT